jgi:hypothetical protein
VDESTGASAQDAVAAPPSGPGRWKRHLVDLATITVGVLIALSLEGVRQWMSDRALVREAEQNLMLEIRENRDEIERLQAGDSLRQEALASALQFADELLEDGTTDVNQLDLGFTVAEVSSASWTTAERTGALAHMDYGRVRELSRVYEAQDLFVAQQGQNLERLASALAILSAGDDPTEAAEDDLRAFRTAVLAFRAQLYLNGELAKRMLQLYGRVLGDTLDAGPSGGR